MKLTETKARTFLHASHTSCLSNATPPPAAACSPCTQRRRACAGHAGPVRYPGRVSASSTLPHATSPPTQVGGHLLARLRELQSRHDVIGDVRGRGLMLGIEMVADRATKAPATAETGQVGT